MSKAADGRHPPGRRFGRVVAGLLIIALAVTGSCVAMRPTHDGPVTDHFDGQRFYDDPPVHKGIGEVLKWQLAREPGGPWIKDTTPVDSEPPPARVGEGELRVTFVNHATVLIQVDGMNLLTDPIWAERASPFGWAGPERQLRPREAATNLEGGIHEQR